MSLKNAAVDIGTTDTIIYTCPAGAESSVHSLYVNNTDATADVLKLSLFDGANTKIIMSDGPVGRGSPFSLPKPINLASGQKLLASTANGTCTATASIYTNDTNEGLTYTFTGAWNSSTAYKTLDVVNDAGSSYVANADNTNSQPPGSNWQLLAEKADAVISSSNFATQAEAEAGTDEAKVMSSLRTKQSILANAPAPVFATQSEAEAGTVTGKVMDPLGTSQAIAAQVSGGAWKVIASGVTSTDDLIINNITGTIKVHTFKHNHTYVRFSNDNGASWIDSYTYSGTAINAFDGQGAGFSDNYAKLNHIGRYGAMEFTLFYPNSTLVNQTYSYTTFGMGGGEVGGGWNNGSPAVTAIRFYKIYAGNPYTVLELQS